MKAIGCARARSGYAHYRTRRGGHVDCVGRATPAIRARCTSLCTPRLPPSHRTAATTQCAAARVSPSLPPPNLARRLARSHPPRAFTAPARAQVALRTQLRDGSSRQNHSATPGAAWRRAGHRARVCWACACGTAGRRGRGATGGGAGSPPACRACRRAPSCSSGARVVAWGPRARPQRARSTSRPRQAHCEAHRGARCGKSGLQVPAPLTGAVSMGVKRRDLPFPSAAYVLFGCAGSRGQLRPHAATRCNSCCLIVFCRC